METQGWSNWSKSHQEPRLNHWPSCALCYQVPPHYEGRTECVCQWNSHRKEESQVTCRNQSARSWALDLHRQLWTLTISSSAKQEVCGIPSRGLYSLYSLCLNISRESSAFPDSLCYWLAPEARIRSRIALSFTPEDSHHSQGSKVKALESNLTRLLTLLQVQCLDLQNADNNTISLTAFLRGSRDNAFNCV